MLHLEVGVEYTSNGLAMTEVGDAVTLAETGLETTTGEEWEVFGATKSKRSGMDGEGEIEHGEDWLLNSVGWVVEEERLS
mmetsp:Transcript_31329/g.52239  ORF Transcript_31329/g.52239 Transcript_31329/m.52239 type:complete len:80 (-) Transcript_31329:21-260(-)